MDSVYGNHYHDNPGTHLCGVISHAENRKWQDYWKRVVQTSPCWYSAPQGRVGKRFISIYINELQGVRMEKWNSECPSIFPALILYKANLVKASKDIQKLLVMAQMDYWEQGKVLDLIQDLEIESSLQGDYQHEKTDDQCFRSFNTTGTLSKKKLAKIFESHIPYAHEMV